MSPLIHRDDEPEGEELFGHALRPMQSAAKPPKPLLPLLPDTHPAIVKLTNAKFELDAAVDSGEPSRKLAVHRLEYVL